MSKIIIHKNDTYLSKSVFDENGIEPNTTKTIFKRNKLHVIVLDGIAYINHDAIPKPTKAVLPSKIDLKAQFHESEANTVVEAWIKALEYQKTKGFVKYTNLLRQKFPIAEYPSISDNKIRTAAQLYAAWTYIMENVGKDVKHMHLAYKAVYEPKICYNGFNNKKNKAKDFGILKVSFKMSCITAKNNIKTVKVVNKLWLAMLTQSDLGLSNRDIHEIITAKCIEIGEEPPSLGWVAKEKHKLLAKNVVAHNSRYGWKKTKDKMLPHQTSTMALYANDQWTIDGWWLPFWVGIGKGFKKFVIVVVRDTYSKKIIGHSISESENTLSIFAAFKDAIENTGCLPHEIVADNHSANKSHEFINFKEELAKIGTQYKVSSNPTDKTTAERYFQYFNSIGKRMYGWTGEGIKSIRKDSHHKQELMDEYAKPANQLTVEQVKLNGNFFVYEFNKDVLEKDGKSPEQMYNESEKPNCFNVDVFQRVRLLTAQTQYKINKGMIIIKRGSHTYEYTLPANLYGKHNGDIVTVRYEDLDECIYLFELKRDNPITKLDINPRIHTALANQTADDTQNALKHHGRKEGIKSAAKKELEKLRDEALKECPEAIHHLNSMNIAKDAYKAAHEDADFNRYVAERGINIKTMDAPNKVKTFVEPKSSTKKPNTAPFAIKNHVMKKVSKNDYKDL